MSSLILIPDGPGTTVEIRDGNQGLPPAPRGTAAIMGQFSSGPVGHAALAVNPSQARLISGDPDDDFEASLALSDVYHFGSPPVLIARVTDGTEVQARSYLWDRNPSRSFSKLNASLSPDRAPFAIAKANNGGRWAGCRRVLVGDVNAIAVDLTANTLDISTSAELSGHVFLKDMWKGALLYLEGDSSGPYVVSGNDTDGVITIEGEFSQAAQNADGSGSIDGRWRLVLESDKELAIVIGQDSISEKLFSVTGFRKFSGTSDWEPVTNYENLGLSENDDRPWISTIDDGERSKYQISIETDYDGATLEEKLPANYCEIPTSVDGATITFQWWRWSEGAENTGNPYISDLAVINANSVEPHVYTITFTTATDFNVTVTWPDGTQQALSTGELGVEFNPGHPQLTKFTLVAGSTAAIDGDELTIRVNPFPHDLASRGAYIYPTAVSADGNPNQRLKIVTNTYNSVTVRSDIDLSDYNAVAGAPASVTGSADLSLVSLSASETLVLTPDGGQTVTLTSAGSGPGAAAIAAELTALDTANLFIFEAVDNKLKISVNGSFGSQSTLLVGSGTANSKIGLDDGATHTGTDGAPARIEAKMPMWGGYDGDVPNASRYQIAFDLSNSVFQRHMLRNLGLVRIATPGIHDYDVKSAAAAFAGSVGWMYIAEFSGSIEATSLPGENALADMLANEAESNHVEHYFPSRAKFFNVAKTKLVTRSISGAIIGLRAFLANVGVDGERGLHIAAANNNEQGRLSPLVRGLPDDIGRWNPPIKLLNDHGIVPVIWSGTDVYLYGNRLYSSGRTPQGKRYTITERAVHYHIARDLFVTTRPFVFKSISVRRLADVQRSLREKMKTYYRDGWFSDYGGTLPGFEQQVLVEVPLALNPPENLQEGKVAATVRYRPRPALEDLKIIISPTQVEG